MNLIKQSNIPAHRSFDNGNEPLSVFPKKNRNGKTTSLMWILRASTQSSQLDVHPGHHVKAGSLRHQQVMNILAEALDEGVEVAFGQDQIP